MNEDGDDKKTRGESGMEKRREESNLSSRMDEGVEEVKERTGRRGGVRKRERQSGGGGGRMEV